MRVMVRTLLTLVMALAVSAPAAAATITFQNLTASWSNVVGEAAANPSTTGNGTGDAQLRWGNPDLALTQERSGYDMATVGSASTSITTGPTADVSLGTFTHRNNPIFAGSTILGARLTIGAEVLLDGNSIGFYDFVYDFTHLETPNLLGSGSSCPDGGTEGVGVNLFGCADRVTMAFNNLSDSFVVGGDLYSLEIRGFRLPGNQFVTGFWTTERLNNSAEILARANLLSDIPGAAVPEPGTLALLGGGLAAAAVSARRARRRSYQVRQP